MDRKPSNPNLPQGADELISRALTEDRTDDDVTTRAVVPDHLDATGRIIAREDGVMAGSTLLPPLFDRLDGEVNVSFLADGRSFEANEQVGRLKGPAQTLLTGERLALNFIQHLSGVATRTRSFVRKVQDLNTVIVDTRKTTPGWRSLEKQAVRMGGGTNHRMNLSEMAMIKENHLEILKKQDRSLDQLVQQLEKSVEVQVEVDAMDELEPVLSAEPSYILLDNMSVEETERAVQHIRSYETNQNVSFKIEASGGIELDDVRAYAQTGVNRISIGSLTHSAPAVDFSMRLDL